MWAGIYNPRDRETLFPPTGTPNMVGKDRETEPLR